MAGLCPNISIMNLNVNSQNIPIKRQIQQSGFFFFFNLNNPTKCNLQESYTRRLKVKEWKKLYHTNIKLKYKKQERYVNIR